MDGRTNLYSNGCVDLTTCNIDTLKIFKGYLDDGIVTLLNAKGAGTTMEVYFKGACNSLITVSLPAGSFLVQAPDDLGNGDTIWISASTTMRQPIPYDDACCRAKYEYRILTADNGVTYSSWVKTYVDGDPATCALKPIPDYNSYSNKMSAQIFHPLTGSYVTLYGTAVGPGEPCQLVCMSINAPPPPPSSFKTNLEIGTKENPLEFSANPTLVTNFIYFTSSKPIQKIIAYDMSGKKVLSNNIFDLRSLSMRKYFILFILLLILLKINAQEVTNSWVYGGVGKQRTTQSCVDKIGNRYSIVEYNHNITIDSSGYPITILRNPNYSFYSYFAYTIIKFDFN